MKSNVIAYVNRIVIGKIKTKVFTAIGLNHLNSTESQVGQHRFDALFNSLRKLYVVCLICHFLIRCLQPCTSPRVASAARAASAAGLALWPSGAS